MQTCVFVKLTSLPPVIHLPTDEEPEASGCCHSIPRIVPWLLNCNWYPMDWCFTASVRSRNAIFRILGTNESLAIRYNVYEVSKALTVSRTARDTINSPDNRKKISEELKYCTISKCSAVTGHGPPWRRRNSCVVTGHFVLGQLWRSNKKKFGRNLWNLSLSMPGRNLSSPKFGNVTGHTGVCRSKISAQRSRVTGHAEQFEMVQY